ncbi:RelA/SpoT family protein [Bacteroidales bacterium OttesenSCG-928-B11]|nr:RelA/SpoT family protein [Bacteroidales bacterium OttesenSCG-928-C03]MDL2312506.1 RelA/SpoT family protein [Bacteroidales bacterium OttesenSCG-928-B11]
MTYKPDIEVERKEILRKYRYLLSCMYDRTTKEQRKRIRKAFTIALNAHQNMRRKSGEPYIYHPLEVATIVAEEIKLGTTSVVCALLHDVVEDTELELRTLRDIFGDTVGNIIDGLTKIDDIEFDSDTSIQAENFRKIFMSMSNDIRVILIKLADRLHNMRTLEFMSEEKRLKISSETSFFYVPIAHRLGLYQIKSELEDCAMKYTNNIVYNHIADKIKSSETERETLIEEFAMPIKERLVKEGIRAEMSSRVKSISSIYEKMKKKKVEFEDIYDIFAIRFVFDSEPKDENIICYEIADIVKKLYKTNPNRERNFLSVPKANGYQSLHVTAMSNSGKWIEVQIRSKRMDEIAENGFAAHFKYKEDEKTPDEYENRVEDWLAKIKEILKSNDVSALDFLNEIKLNLNLKEIVLFTPKGDSFTMPAQSTVLDFAYELHTKLGAQCIGAKVNYNIVPIDYILQNGDQVEVITSKKQKPKIDWLDFVTTSRAKESIKEAIRVEQKKSMELGKAKLKAMLDELDLKFEPQNYGKIQSGLKMRSQIEFWSFIAEDKLTLDRIKKILSNEKNTELESFQKRVSSEIENKSLDDLINEELSTNPEIFMLDDTSDKIRHVVAPCCKPLPGDQVVGFQMSDDVIFIHQTNCPKAIEQMSKFGNRIIKAKWKKEQKIAFLSGIRIEGFDKKGMIKDIVNVISSQLDLNIRSLNIETQGNIFNGKLMIYIQNVKSLRELIEKLKQIDNVERVDRIGYETE